jgi:hypothetical protein
MRKLIAFALVLALGLAAAPINLAARGQNRGQISGTATVEGKPLANVTVRLRNVDTNQVVGTLTANAAGSFSFTGLPAGSFVVEAVTASGAVLGTSTATLTAATMTVTGLSVSASAAAVAAAGGIGAITGTAAAIVGSAAGLSTTALVAGTVLAGLTATGLTVALNDASGSQ